MGAEGQNSARGGFSDASIDDAIARAVETYRQVESKAARFLDTLRVVKRARFNASKRFERKADLSSAAISTFSLYLIFISVYTALYSETLTVENGRLLNLISISASIFILIVTFIISGKSYPEKSKAMHKCGTSLGRLLHEAELTTIVNLEQLRVLAEKYNDIIDACPWNHDGLDYARAKFERPANWSERGWRIWIDIRYFLAIYWFYFTLMTTPAAALFYVLG